MKSPNLAIVFKIIFSKKLSALRLSGKTRLLSYKEDYASINYGMLVLVCNYCHIIYSTSIYIYIYIRAMDTETIVGVHNCLLVEHAYSIRQSSGELRVRAIEVRVLIIEERSVSTSPLQWSQYSVASSRRVRSGTCE